MHFYLVLNSKLHCVPFFSETIFTYVINMELRGLPFFRILPFMEAVNKFNIVLVIITKLQITLEITYFN